MINRFVKYCKECNINSNHQEQMFFNMEIMETNSILLFKEKLQSGFLKTLEKVFFKLIDLKMQVNF